MGRYVVTAAIHNQEEEVDGKTKVVTYLRGDEVEVSDEEYERLADGLAPVGSEQAEKVEAEPAVHSDTPSASVEAPVPSEPEDGGEDQGDDALAYEDLTNAQLQARLRARGLAVSGNKDELIARLEEADEDEQA